MVVAAVPIEAAIASIQVHVALQPVGQQGLRWNVHAPSFCQDLRAGANRRTRCGALRRSIAAADHRAKKCTEQRAAADVARRLCLRHAAIADIDAVTTTRFRVASTP